MLESEKLVSVALVVPSPVVAQLDQDAAPVCLADFVGSSAARVVLFVLVGETVVQRYPGSPVLVFDDEPDPGGLCATGCGG